MRHFYCATLFCLLAQTVSAAPPPYNPFAPKPPTIRGLISLTAGIDWADITQSSSVLLLSEAPAPDNFVPASIYSSKFMWGGGVGVEFPLSKTLFWQTSIDYYQANHFKTTGTDYMFSDPSLGNRDYSYEFSNQRILLENKLLFTLIPSGFQKPGMFMYMMFGLGASRNRAGNFKEIQTDPMTPINGAFGPGTKESFAYSIGFGFEGELATFARIGLGYRYVDMGQLSLGPLNDGNTTQTITANNIPTQELVFQLTVLTF